MMNGTSNTALMSVLYCTIARFVVDGTIVGGNEQSVNARSFVFEAVVFSSLSSIDGFI